MVSATADDHSKPSEGLPLPLTSPLSLPLPPVPSPCLPLLALVQGSVENCRLPLRARQGNIFILHNRGWQSELADEPRGLPEHEHPHGAFERRANVLHVLASEEAAN